MSASRVLFKVDPGIVVTERTEIGTAIGWRLSPEGKATVRAQLEAGPHLTAFDAGVGYIRDIAGPDDLAHLVQIEDDELVAEIDRDRALRADDTDAVVVDVT